MYDVRFRKLVMQMVGRVGVVKTSIFTCVSRSTIWRWGKYGVNPKKRRFISHLFTRTNELIKLLLLRYPCATARDIVMFLKEIYDINISTKSVYKFIGKIRFSRKRSHWRGQSMRSDDWELRKEIFLKTYSDAIDQGKLIISIDECGFSERVKPLYGYSPVGQPLVLKTKGGGWIHHSLLMAVFSDGRNAFIIKKGSIKRVDVNAFINSLNIDKYAMIVLDNASIHKNLQLDIPHSICFTPPYSPEYNAIELCFAKIKGYFRSTNNGTTTFDVPRHIERSINTLSGSIIISCFRHVHNIVGTNSSI